MFKSENHLTNNLIGVVLISALMFVLVYLVDRSNPQPAGARVLWFLALVGGAALVAWIVLAYRRYLGAGGSSAT